MQRRRHFIGAAIGAGTGISSGFFTSCAKKPVVAVGSKEGTEQMLLGEIVSLMLERKAQGKVNRMLSFGLSSSISQAVSTGDIDVYPEYSHVAYRTYFKVDEPLDPVMSLDRLQLEYRQNKRAELLAPLGFENNYTALVLADNPRVSAIQSLTQMALDEAGWKLGYFREFSQGGDGYNLFKSTYRFSESAAPLVDSFDSLFSALDSRMIEILVVGSTDARVKKPSYRILQDDKNIFGRNWASLVARQDMLDKHPGVLAVLQSLSGKISNEAMQQLNGKVDLDKRPYAEVAADWVSKSGLV